MVDHSVSDKSHFSVCFTQFHNKKASLLKQKLTHCTKVSFHSEEYD